MVYVGLKYGLCLDELVVPRVIDETVKNALGTVVVWIAHYKNVSPSKKIGAQHVHIGIVGDVGVAYDPDRLATRLYTDTLYAHSGQSIISGSVLAVADIAASRIEEFIYFTDRGTDL
jgi:hypothetical protein